MYPFSKTSILQQHKNTAFMKGRFAGKGWCAQNRGFQMTNKTSKYLLGIFPSLS